MIDGTYGKDFLPETPNVYKVEERRRRKRTKPFGPSSVARHPDEIKQYLQEDEFKVYKLIWQRFVASQMTPAVFDQTTHRHRRQSRERIVTGSA